MPLQRFAHSRWYRLALHAALTAMLLLLIGPLISQSQAGHHDHHAGHAHDASHAHHHQAHEHHDHAALQAPEPIFTWFHECGYCSLWQQFPSAHAFLPAIARQAFIHHAPLPQMPQLGFASLDNYRHAPPRAPPTS